MYLENITISGRKGFTVFYSFIPVLTEIVDGINIKWDGFKFYSPIGPLSDGENYFEVPSINENIFKDSSFDKEIFIAIKFESECNVNIIERYIGSIDEAPLEYVGMEGDIILSGVLPSTSSSDQIQMKIKEVK